MNHQASIETTTLSPEQPVNLFSEQDFSSLNEENVSKVFAEEDVHVEESENHEHTDHLTCRLCHVSFDDHFSLEGHHWVLHSSCAAWREPAE